MRNGVILQPLNLLGIETKGAHFSQIFSTNTFDFLWFIKNKFVHEGFSLNALRVSRQLKQTSLEQTSLEHLEAQRWS
jgi:hypothetical protein